jgi:hypothetical protein
MTDETLIQIDLDDLEDAFLESEAPSTEEVPEGTYQATIHKVGLGTTSTGLRKFSWQFKIVSGEHTGRLVFKNNILETKDGSREGKLQQLGFLKGDLGRVGVSLESLKDLPNIMQDLLDLGVEIKKQKSKNLDQNGNPQFNVYINRRITVDPSVIAGSSAVNDSLCPF